MWWSFRASSASVKLCMYSGLFCNHPTNNPKKTKNNKSRIWKGKKKELLLRSCDERKGWFCPARLEWGKWRLTWWPTTATQTIIFLRQSADATNGLPGGVHGFTRMLAYTGQNLEYWRFSFFLFLKWKSIITVFLIFNFPFNTVI